MITRLIAGGWATAFAVAGLGLLSFAWTPAPAQAGVSVGIGVGVSSWHREPVVSRSRPPVRDEVRSAPVASSEVVSRRTEVIDGQTYERRVIREVREVERPTWTFPSYVGNLGIDFFAFPDLDDDSHGLAGVYYKHLQSAPGPVYFGFELAPFAFGSIRDRFDDPSIFLFSTRALFLTRLYFDLKLPKIYLEAGIGAQFVGAAADEYEGRVWTDDGVEESVGEWAFASRLAVGLEVDFVVVELAYSWLAPSVEFAYQPDNQASRREVELGSAITLTFAFRFASS